MVNNGCLTTARTSYRVPDSNAAVSVVNVPGAEDSVPGNATHGAVRAFTSSPAIVRYSKPTWTVAGLPGFVHSPVSRNVWEFGATSIGSV